MQQMHDQHRDALYASHGTASSSQQLELTFRIYFEVVKMDFVSISEDDASPA